jgi:Ca2+-binding RTX toxin-like protein
VAGVNNAFIGLTNFNSATAGISTIDLNGKTGVVIAGSGSTLNLSGLTITDSSGSGQTATILASASYQTVTGTAGADYIKVQSYGDTINGGGGNDVFDIKSGSNTLYGGAGNVRFLLDGTYGSDTIADFAASRDTIDITADAGHYDWNNLLSHATSSGANLILHTDISGDTVTLNGVLSGGQTASGYLTQNMSAFKLA